MKITVGQLRRIIKEEVEQEKVRRVVRKSINEGFFDSIKRTLGVGKADSKVLKAAESLMTSMPIPGFEDVKFTAKDAKSTMANSEGEDEAVIQLVASPEDQEAFVDAMKDPKNKAAIKQWRAEFQNKVKSDKKFAGYHIDPVLGRA
jgi:hypothetical protein